ncbi:MAG: hypothetical protein LBT37_02155, partial [Lactobacillaceae bacterium]|nr:hypothetical protein [Lactobacillaceae bacterium]
QAGAQIPKGHVISVSLAAGQTFSAAYDESTTVPYKVKINTTPGIANTTGGAVSVLTANADVAHDTGATATMKVGFDSAPTFKYAGTYSDSVQFEVSCDGGVPIVIAGMQFDYVKSQTGKELYVLNGTASHVPYCKDYYKAYGDSLLRERIDDWFEDSFAGHTNNDSDATIDVDGYTIYKTTLNGATSASTGNFNNVEFQNLYQSVPEGGVGTNAITAYAFAVSKADINAQSASSGDPNTKEGTRVAQNLETDYTYLRSPGQNSTSVGAMNASTIYSLSPTSPSFSVKPAIWIDSKGGK